jgi:large subunit ribosomal protein L25
MAGERIQLEVQERDRSGTRESRRLRREGIIPGVLYGRGKPPHAICVSERELRRVLTGSGGLHAILDVVLAGQKTTHSSILKDYQVDPIRGKIEHFDLHEVRLDVAIQTSVIVELVGESVGAKAGGALSQVSRCHLYTSPSPRDKA